MALRRDKRTERKGGSNRKTQSCTELWNAGI